MTLATEVIWNKCKIHNKFNEWFVFIYSHRMMQSCLKQLLTKKKMLADTAGPILESKGIGAIFQKKGNEV